MQVLAPPSVAPPPPYASISSPAPRRAAARSLLDRRPSAQRLLTHAEPSLFVSNVVAAAPPLPFVPLTPIMASPRMTPDLRAPGDYLSRGLPTPSWTSTPPTPPAAPRTLAPSPRASTSGDARAPAPSNTTYARSTSRTRHARPASVSVFTSPSSSAMDLCDDAPKRPALHSRSVSPPRASSAGEGRRVKRRRTLPNSLSCLSPPPGPVDRASPPADDDGALQPSLSRTKRGGEEARPRRMFTLGGGDCSDNDADAESSTPPPTQASDAPADDRTRAGARRYHALLELLTTEVGYLLDLRALVSVYLEQLPSLTTPVPMPPRSSPSALSISSLGLSRPARAQQQQYQHQQAAGLGPPAPDGGGDAPLRRPVFSEADVEAVRRNARELLERHERLVGALEGVLGPRGYAWVFARGRAGREDPPVGAVDEAVAAALEVFLREMPAFAVYEAFCPGHSAAADAARAAQDAHPREWDAFEQRCSLLVAHAFELAPTASPLPPSGSFDSLGRRRRHSMSSLVLPPAPLRASDPLAVAQAMRLKFLDYLIKPVQRICRYPLLLAQLRPKHGGGGGLLLLLDRTEAAMRAAVARVDRASEREAHRRRAALVAARLCFHGPVSPTSPEVPERPAQLSGEFVHSLGACVAAGALDVVYHGARVKYLAAFLYGGGYLILAKVPKGGRVYEAKHWFALAGFQVFEETEGDAVLPFGFHLYNASVHLHLAAAGEAERRCWVACFAEALSAAPPAPWVAEPAPSFPPDARPLLFDEPVSERPTPPLPTIQSMSALGTPADEPLPSPRRAPRTLGRVEGAAAASSANMAALSRRTSSSSVKAFFAPLTFEGRVGRPSAQIRQQVDAGIRDVVSDALLHARARGRAAPVARSNSGLALAAAAPNRRRHDSLAFAAAAARRKGSLDGVPDAPGEAEQRRKGLRRRSRQPLSPAPPALTHSFSGASFSALPSPHEPPPVAPLLPAEPARRPPKRTRSLVDNVRSFFAGAPSPSPASSPPSPDAEIDPHGALARWWRRGSLRRRVQSSPEVPTDDASAPPTPAASSASEDGGGASPERRLFRSRVAFSSVAPMTRRRSLFASAPPPTTTPTPTLARSRTLKHLLQLSRSSSFAHDPDAPLNVTQPYSQS